MILDIHKSFNTKMSTAFSKIFTATKMFQEKIEPEPDL